MLRKLLLSGIAVIGMAGVASAADMPLKAPPPAAYDWSGFYIGGVIGGGWGDSDSSIPGLGIIGTLAGVPVTQTTSNSGFIGGIEGGDRYQLGKLVVGWEADMLWGGINGTSTTTFGPSFIPPGIFSLTRSMTADTNWTGTATSSVGIAHNNWLIYGKAGVAWAHTNYSDNWTANVVGTGIAALTGAGSDNRVGWTVGTGVEWAFWNNWSLKVEYDYLDFGSRTVTMNGAVAPTVIAYGVSDTNHINEVKAGLNWHIAPNIW
jgi:outer membrane immunogenic protein